MIFTPLYNGSIERKPLSRVNSGINIHVPRYCKELEDVIAIAIRKGYMLPTEYQLKMLNFLINESKSNGLFSTYDLLYVFGLGLGNVRPYTLAGSSSTPAGEKYQPNISPFTYINIKNPNLFELTRFNSTGTQIAPFISQFGQSNVGGALGSAGYLNTNYVPLNHATNWSQNSAGASVYCSNVGQTGNGCVIGTLDTVAVRRAITMRISNGTNFQGRVNLGTTTFNVANTDVSGFYRIDRSASNLTTVYKNGVSIGTNTGVSTSVIGTTSVFLMQLNSDGTGTDQWPGVLGYCSLGSSLSSTLQKTEYDLFTQFRTKLGYQ